MLLMMGAAILLVGLTMMIHYEALRVASDLLPGVPLPPRLKIVFLVFAAFLAHTLEVWTYGIAYDLLESPERGQIVHVSGPVGDIFDHVYFSAATFSTLGFGDVVPTGALRLLAGVEALNGFVLVGWTASVTYIAMQAFWPLHAARRAAHGRARR